MRELISAIPDVEVLLQLEPEELGSILLPLLLQRKTREPNFKPHLPSLTSELRVNQHEHGARYPDNRVAAAQRAMVEGWMWLERLGLLLPAEGDNGVLGWREFSRKAVNLGAKADVQRFAKSKGFPKEMLHMALHGASWSAFIRGEYDTAVFEAMKAVEIAVRLACPDIDRKEFGVTLARKAFAFGGTQPGPLTDTNLPPGEQEAMMHLFGGALGTFKNAHAHRNVNLDDPQQARETIGFASLLLTIVDARATDQAQGG